MADTDCVQFPGGTPGASMARSYSGNVNSFAFYMRAKLVSDTADGWTTFVVLLNENHRLETDGGTVYFATDLNNPSGSSIALSTLNDWYDMAGSSSGSTLTIYRKTPAATSWTVWYTFDNADQTLESLRVFGGDATTGTYKIGKFCFWNEGRTTTELINEANNSRDLVNSSGIFFYNRCDVAGSVGTDGGGGGNDFTVSGTPTTESDDPGFPTGGGGGVAVTPDHLPTLSFPVLCSPRRQGRWQRKRGSRLYTFGHAGA